MKFEIAGLLTRPNRNEIALEVEDELCFHVEMLERKYLEQGMSPAEAKGAALRRFGDLEKYKRQCEQISRRNRGLRRVLKTLLILLGLGGLIIRLLSSDVHFDHLGDVLIMIAVAGRLLLYVRGLPPRNPECS
jgi:hypothetical protein